ncbi:MAG TPA: protein-export chaperone SecB [Gammaproteobacteria bacterium]|nr:protein-export chaperone SecB [Gammaproteobacteria bacterium]
MTEENTTASQETVEREFQIQKIYLKDVSFETPNTPGIFQKKWEPEIGLQLGNSAVTLGDNVHEIVLTVTVTAKIGEETAYLCEVKQAGIFTITGYSDQDMGAMAGSYCPNILFPYAREAISDLVVKGGFPQMLLAPVNFEALYQQHLQQAQAGETATTTH